MIKTHFHPLLALAGCIAIPAHVRASELVYEPFNYTAAENLTSQVGGSGWADGWTQDGQSSVIGTDGLTYTDAIGNILNFAGKTAATTGTATTRNFRAIANGPLTDVWISFLYQLPASNLKFEGLSFYRGSQALFAISSSSVDPSAAISLGNTLAGGGVSTQKGSFGVTHFVVLHLTEGAGAGGTDRVEAFIDPLLAGVPSLPDGTIYASNFDFDAIRLAGQDGSTLWVDEFRIGYTFNDVSPHLAVAPSDGDGDGLTDAEEAVLGLDPGHSDAALIAAIQSHPDYFGLYDSTGMLGLGQGGVVLAQTANNPVNFIFEVQHSVNLTAWPAFETYSRNVELPDGKNFLRVTLDNR